MDIKEKLFRENHLFTREDILESLELFIEYEKLNEDARYSNDIVKNRIQLCEKFVSAVMKSKLPVLSELWWYYDYQFFGSSMELDLCHANEIEVRDDEIGSVISTIERTLITVECDYLNVEQYAALHGVKPATVRQWIKRGRLRRAKKDGRDWVIPNTEDRPSRDYGIVQYLVEKDTYIESDEFPILATCDSIFIFQDENNKDIFICYFNNYKTKFRSKLELTRSEAERLEYTIIASGKARVEASIQYAPQIGEIED
jgi:hypothetical protein